MHAPAAPLTWRARLLTAFRWWGDLPLSLLWLAGAIALLNLASDLGNSFGLAPRFGGPLVAWPTFVALVGFFGVALVALVLVRREAATPSPGLPRPWWRSGIAALLTVWALWTAVQAVPVLLVIPRDLASPTHYGSDEMYYAHYNAWLVLHGQNPYLGDRLAPALRAFATASITPLRLEPFADPLAPPDAAATRALIAAYLADPARPPPNIAPATTHSYPALSFLIAVPSVWAGLPTIGFAQVAALLLGIVGIIALSPARWRPAIALLCLLDVDGLRSVAASDFAIWTATGACLVWLLAVQNVPTNQTSSHFVRALRVPFASFASHVLPAWKGIKRTGTYVWRPPTRFDWAAIILGLVCAVQQTAWFFVPFSLAHAWHRAGWRGAARMGLIALGAFLAVNLPWALTAPKNWLSSLILPLTLPLFPTGSGLVALGLGGAMPLFPPVVYTLLEFAAYAVLLAGYALRGRALPLAGLILPLAPVLLAWRSPSRYFILLPFVAILAWALTRAASSPPPEPESAAYSRTA